jgi:hypothetical protein
MAFLIVFKTKIMAFELSIFLENKITHLEKVTAWLKGEKINIRSLMLNNIHHGWGVLNIIVDEPERAYEMLTKKGSSVSMREVIALEMKDETGGLDELLIHISKSGIHVESAYSRLISQSKLAILILEVPDFLEAKRRLEISGIKVLDDKVVYGK